MARAEERFGLCGICAAGVDTDQLIPARFMSAPHSKGYGKFLLRDLRRSAGALDTAFPLNRPKAKGASILVAARNFGGGSSREAAVYALVDADFRMDAAPSFGDIFAGNAVNNGLLTAQIAEADQFPKALSPPTKATIDLDRCRLTLGALTASFDVDPVRRIKLIKGWDDIDLTQNHADQI